MRKKTVLVIALLSMLVIMAGCANEQAGIDNTDELGLEIYLNNDERIIEDIVAQPIGATGPRLVYAYKEYAVILNYNGMLIYDFEEDSIVHTVDNLALGLNKMQGSDPTIIKTNETAFALGNADTIENTAYIYDMEKNRLQLTNAQGIEGFKTVEDVADDELLDDILGDNSGNAVYNDDGDIVLLSYRYEDGTDSWELSIFAQDSMELIKQVNVFE